MKKERHPPLTGLEARFEKELSVDPDWVPWGEENPEIPHPVAESSESDLDQAVEQAMISGT